MTEEEFLNLKILCILMLDNILEKVDCLYKDLSLLDCKYNSLE